MSLENNAWQNPSAQQQVSKQWIEATAYYLNMSR
jgi:hypothetical protein